MPPNPSTLEQDLIKLRKHQQVLMELAHLATFEPATTKLLHDAVALVGGAVEVGHAKVMRYRASSGDLLVEAGVGWMDGVVGQATFAVDLASPPGRAFQTAQPVVLNGIVESGEYRLSPVLRDHGIVSLLNVPIQIDGAVWGILEVDSVERRDFNVDTKDFVLTAASILAAALRREQVAAGHTSSLAAVAAEAHRNETLLQEMQHRVKNNFQTILSMVAIYKSRLQGPEGRDALEKIGESIIAMGLAHDQLAPTRHGEMVHLPTYLKALTSSIQKPLETVTIETHAEEISLPIERAMPVGLLVNELVTNSVKHAFDERGGAIRVQLVTAAGTGRLRLLVSDNGKGLEDAREGTGSRLIAALVLQLRGRIERHSGDEGTVVEISFAP